MKTKVKKSMTQKVKDQIPNIIIIAMIGLMIWLVKVSDNNVMKSNARVEQRIEAIQLEFRQAIIRIQDTYVSKREFDLAREYDKVN